ncbi:unnamed protein product [Linum tenue]|uniref:non-specific serine/threonine protein kinase n=1 Tax=Linum tenue TaxID=586396 RepID=A0AAV0IUP8_9ROSI|nr:unnamed protein product [Linum tenue]
MLEVGQWNSMRNLFKKLHSAPNQPENTSEGGSTSSRGSKLSLSEAERLLQPKSNDSKPFSGLSNWLNSVTNRKSPSPPSSSNASRGGERMKPSDSVSSSGASDVASSNAMVRDSGSAASRGLGHGNMDEEYQIQLALEMSAIEDPEAAQIEAVKQISLGSSDPENTPAEVVAYRYWNYNALSYDDKILDGFYDLYGILTDSQSDRMPSLVELQATPVTESITWEAVLVDRTADANLLKLEQKAQGIAGKLRSESVAFADSHLVKKLASLVSNYMGGSVGDPENMSRAWRRLSYSLKVTLGSMVLPLGSLTIGMARHRALMFKVLADNVGIPSRLVKGHQFTGSDDVVMNFVKLDDGREYIIDLMADPGTLIPSDAAGLNMEYGDLFFSASPLSRDIDSSHLASSSSGVASSSVSGTLERRSRGRNDSTAPSTRSDDDKVEAHESLNSRFQIKGNEGSRSAPDDIARSSGRHNLPYAHARSPSWTEGISSPAARKKKVKDVSKYMIDAAKENPQLAQKLHDVLVESGVNAPPSLFTEFEQLSLPLTEGKSVMEDDEDPKHRTGTQQMQDNNDPGPARFLPPLPHYKMQSRATSAQLRLSSPETVSMVDEPSPARYFPLLPQYKGHSNATSYAQGQTEQRNHPFIMSSECDASPGKYVKNVPVAAAAAAAAAVVASSMMVACCPVSNLELPVAAAAAAVVATTAAVSKKQHDHGVRSDGDTDSTGYEPRGSGDRGSGGRGSGGQEHDVILVNLEGERISDRLTGNDSPRPDINLDDVAECEIPWEEITLGERIGLGSYGEVYHGEWHGTEVAVKRFLNQDISGESLTEFKSEVQIMKRLRHPNVVLFMGAVTRAPNLSIITEFLPRGSLYRLLHRPNNQLDERRRLRMALDTARGMNYLHNCTPVVVHRDLKSPNLLVDKNWVVKVCDFGLSRMKHSTFLSSRSAAGTAEWMAPEVLRNEPSDEKCDVYSYGVILWELCTMQQPWGGMNPMQVVGAVGFQHRRLEIPNDMDPAVADIILRCWQTDPKLRPTFGEIMAALKPLQKPITGSAQGHRHATRAVGAESKGQSPQGEYQAAG